MNNFEKLEDIKQRRIQLEKEEKDLLSKLKSEKLPIERLFEFVDKKNWSFGISKDSFDEDEDIVYYLEYIGDISEILTKFDVGQHYESLYLKNSHNEQTIELNFLPRQIVLESIWIDDLITIIKENDLRIIKKDFQYIERQIYESENLLQKYKNILEELRNI